MVGVAAMGASISLDGVAVHGVSACVIFILQQKIQKMAKYTFWYQLTRVVPDSPESCKMVVCCVCVRACVRAAPNLHIAYLITSLGTLSKAFSKSTKPK